MPFDSPTRNKLQKMVSSCRRILTEEFTSQLQGLYGVQPTGEIASLASLSHLDDEQHTVASLLRERIDHLAGGLSTDKKKVKEAIDRVIREQAFTVLNRLAALRMCEERGIVQECIRGGFQSRGFQVYCTTVRASLGGIYERYQVFLQCVFDEISVDLGVLFDRFSPFGLLFPREPALVEVLKVLNDTELTDIWKDDETIGWVYQYFNSKEEREAMRKASAAPRSSRELAVRNQFFTPRYVVEFLTDNTLGRIWYEMTKGETRLTDACCFLVRRPNEIFLAKGEEPPHVKEDKTLEKSQEELLKEPVYIPYRPVKDPREIRMLDPACGSMHFGLYAFDLYEHIYEEAWDHYPEFMLDLREDYPTKEEFLKRVPELILRHNIYGIDIDPRACQIAGLSLWLRAQQSYQQLGFKAGERPRITRANVVCAEPMPGEKNLLEEFISTFRGEQRIVGELVKEVWERMQLAGEAGSLLKIEVELREAIERVRKEWEDVRRGQPVGQLPMWPDRQLPRQLEIRKALGGIKREAFWDQAEGWVLEALKHFAEKAGNGKGYQRKLFADDAAQGFAFIDMCQNKYDVVLMNPPYGSIPEKPQSYLRQVYSDAHNDIFVGFVERVLALLTKCGVLGAITSRNFMFNQRLTRFRKEFLIGSTSLNVLADLGNRVLDAAVDVAAFTAEVNAFKPVRKYGLFFELLSSEDKVAGLKSAVSDFNQYNKAEGCSVRERAFFRLLPDHRISYTAPTSLVHLFSLNSLQPQAGTVLKGLITGNDERYVRVWHELHYVDESTIWRRFHKGGDYSPYYSDVTLLLNWRQNGEELKSDAAQKYGSASRTIKNEMSFGKEGLGWGVNNSIGFAVKCIPRGCFFADIGPVFQPRETEKIYSWLGYLNTTIVKMITRLFQGGERGRFMWIANIVEQIPIPRSMTSNEIATFARDSSLLFRGFECLDEVSPLFCGFLALEICGLSLTEISNRYNANLKKSSEQIADQFRLADKTIEKLFNSDFEDAAELRQSISLYENPAFVMASKYKLDCYALTESIYGISLGCILGRWDARIFSKPSLSPKLPDPFDPLPVCPPGMLIGPNSLPANAGGIVSEEWLRARPDAITLPPDGSVSRPTIPDEEYPLRITWSGILVEDSDSDETQAHPEDILRRVREVLDLVWVERAQAIEQEACEILGVSSLRDYFRKPSGFFDDHLKRYSKSRRKAPIYWPLSTESGSYTLWIYYHRLTDQTLYQCVNDFIDPKLESVRQDADRLRGEVLKGGSAKQRDQLEKLQKLQQELTDFRTELLRVAAIPYQPNLNDGVLVTASPLRRLFRLPRWRKDLEECWKKLESGEYDWAHLAYSIWPDRVREKCKKDKSIAIAHGLEELYEEIPTPKKTKRGKKSV